MERFDSTVNFLLSSPRTGVKRELFSESCIQFGRLYVFPFNEILYFLT